MKKDTNYPADAEIDLFNKAISQFLESKKAELVELLTDA